MAHLIANYSLATPTQEINYLSTWLTLTFDPLQQDKKYVLVHVRTYLAAITTVCVLYCALFYLVDYSVGNNIVEQCRRGTSATQLLQRKVFSLALLAGLLDYSRPLC